jgi:hypothetical protein
MEERIQLVECLLDRFRYSFPSITYEVLWSSHTVNAQALEFAGQRWVKLYGGLACHPAMKKAGLAVALAHETGHHLGGPPYHPYLPWLSSEERADEWATTAGLPSLFPPAIARTLLREGRRQILRVQTESKV